MRFCRLVVNVERSVPSEESAVSCDWRAVSCVCHGVSIADWIARIELTVEVTSKPVPLVAEPKLSPTVPIIVSQFQARSRCMEHAARH